MLGNSLTNLVQFEFVRKVKGNLQNFINQSPRLHFVSTLIEDTDTMGLCPWDFSQWDFSRGHVQLPSCIPTLNILWLTKLFSYLLLAFPGKFERTTGVSSWDGINRESLWSGFSLVFLVRERLRNGISMMENFKYYQIDDNDVLFSQSRRHTARMFVAKT